MTNINSTILKFIKDMDYINNKHVLGIFFYGSYLTGFNSKDSDIDLHIIFDNDDPKHLIRGNKVVDGIRIEYFEKTIGEVYKVIENDYNNQSNAPLLIFGNTSIVYSKDNQLKELQEYVINKFSSSLPPLNEEEAKEQIAIIDNRMEKLRNYAYTDNLYFEHLYYLTIDKIRRFYHRLKGISFVEASKCLKLYKNDEYRKSFHIDNLPEETFINMYFKALESTSNNKVYRYRLINALYNFTKRNVDFDSSDYRIHIKSRNEGFEVSINKPTDINELDSVYVPLPTLKIALKFIKEMNYLNDIHCLGIVLYGSSLTGFNTKGSDIDIEVIYDNEDEKHLIRGTKTIDGVPVEYFERPIKDVYLEVENGYMNQNNAAFSIIGMGVNIYDRNNEIKKLKQYTLDKFKSPMPPLDEEEAKEQMSIINNRMEKLEKSALENSTYFDYLYHIAINKIRKFYHRLIGISKIPTSKVHKIYTDEGYRKSVYKENPDQKFIDMYTNLITTKCSPVKKYEMINEFYNYVTRNINLGSEYRILIKSISEIKK